MFKLYYRHSVKMYKETDETKHVQQLKLDVKHIQLIRGVITNHIAQVEYTSPVEYRE